METKYNHPTVDHGDVEILCGTWDTDKNRGETETSTAKTTGQIPNGGTSGKRVQGLPISKDKPMQNTPTSNDRWGYCIDEQKEHKD